MHRLFALLAFTLTPLVVMASSWSVLSPDGNLRFEVKNSAPQGLQYRVLLMDETVVGWSALGMIRSDWDKDAPEAKILTDFSSGLSLQEETARSGSDRYTLVTGKQRDNQVTWNELWLEFKNTDGHPIRLEARAYDTGAAFRYVFPDTDPVFQTIEEELTGFNMGTEGKVWLQPYQFSTYWTPAYENFFKNGIQAGTSVDPDEGVGWAFPALFHIGDTWILLHESGLDANYHGTHLQPEVNQGVYTIAPPDQEDGIGVGINQASSTLPWSLPWRFFVISKYLGEIVASNRVFDLAAPQAVADTSWIRPGPSSWSWWSDHDSSQNMKALKHFIDFAKDMDWPYSLIDANWDRISETSMEELVDYAESKGVDLLFWYNSGGINSAVTEGPRNRLSDVDTRRAEFKKISDLGVKGVKIDFFQSDKQFMIQQYLGILEDAATYQLVVNFHGCTIPRGWERTYPNLVTSEAVRGAETYSFGANYAEFAPWHNTILPFTRNVIGSMDYTPVTWTERQNRPRFTSDVHEIALATLFESGIQHYADSVEAYQRLPKIYKQFLTQAPTIWDETRYLAGYPGKDVVLARRHGKRWFISGINGEATDKSFELDLAFIGKPARKATLLYDGDTNQPFASKTIDLNANTTLPVQLKPYGGFVLWID